MTESERDKKYFGWFLVFYVFIILCWIFFMIFHFTTYFGDSSPVIAQYLTNGQIVSPNEVQPDWVVRVVDIIVKANLILVSALVGTIFLLYNIFPKMKNLNVLWMSLSFLAAYFPSFLTLFSILFGIGNVGNILGKPVSFFQFLSLVVLYPLNYAVFFYFYYMLDTFVFKKNEIVKV